MVSTGGTFLIYEATKCNMGWVLQVLVYNDQLSVWEASLRCFWQVTYDHEQLHAHLQLAGKMNNQSPLLTWEGLLE